jgi:hypothetical protein
MLGDFGQGRKTPLIALDRNDLARALGQKGAGQAAGAGPDLDDRCLRERTRGPRDAPRQIEVEQKILPERFFRGKSMGGNDVPERWKII